jgi:signal transduction histidine kinase
VQDRGENSQNASRMSTARDTERLRRLQLLTDAALAHLDLEELLGALLVRVREVLEADTTAILLLDASGRELVARAAVGIEEEVDQGVRIPIGRGFAGRVAATRAPVILDDVDHADVLNPILRDKGIKSMLGVPLLVEGLAIGVLHVGTLTPRQFEQADVDLLQFAADRAAIAIEHARLYAAERAARERLEHIQVVTDAALGHLELDELLGVLLPRIREILRTDTCVVLLLDEERDDLLATAAVGLEEEVEQGVRVPMGKGFAGRVAAYRKPIILDDVDTADVVNPILRQKGIKSMLGVPLLFQERAIGVLHVASLTPRKFTSEEQELLELVAARVAIAIERTRLHEEIVELDQLKANFVAIASHELRTPATSVYGVFSTLVSRPQLDPQLQSDLIRVGYEQAERLRRLLEQLLDLSRLDATAVRVQPRRLELDAVLRGIAAETLPAGTPCEVRVAPGADVEADPLVVDRVVSNLLLNAVRYGAPPIRLEAEQRGSDLLISVEDGGTGVPPELEGRLFDRFTRGDDAPGTGLGLAIARAYARAHGGDLVYQPRSAGARFELTVPQAAI